MKVLHRIRKCWKEFFTEIDKYAALLFGTLEYGCSLNVLQIQQMIHYLVAIKLHSFDLQEKLEFPFE